MVDLISTNIEMMNTNKQFENKDLLSYVYNGFDEKKFLCYNEDPNTSTVSSIYDLLLDTTSVCYGLSKKLLFNLEKVKKISELKNNWDGEGAEAFSDLLIDDIRSIIMHLYIQPNVFPLPNGNIQLEAKNGDCIIEIEVGINNDTIVNIVDENDKEYNYKVKRDYNSFNEVLRKFYEHRF